MTDKTPRVEISSEECKGCELCIAECPKKVLFIGKNINHLGYTYAEYTGEGCIGCGMCFYACPEPGAITVFKKIKDGGDKK